MVWYVWYGMVWYGMDWYGMVWYVEQEQITENHQCKEEKKKKKYESRYSVFLINNPCFERSARTTHETFTEINQLCIK